MLSKHISLIPGKVLASVKWWNLMGERLQSSNLLCIGVVVLGSIVGAESLDLDRTVVVSAAAFVLEKTRLRFL
jgi:hypothetical protein